MTIKCPYCGHNAELVGGRLIYPHRLDLASKTFFKCEPCDAYVGTHEGTIKPLGRLANAELRKKKMEAHAAFDPLWEHGELNRSGAYRLLSEQLGINAKGCHIGMFDLDMCEKTILACKQIKESSNASPH